MVFIKKISSFVIIAVIMISYSTCRRDQCWNSTYDDRKNEDSLSKFNSSCGRRNGQRYINGYSIILQGCAVNENVNCCCTGVENSDCKPGSSLNNGKCEICKQGSYNINYSESECMNLPKEFENNKIDNIIPTGDQKILKRSVKLSNYTYDMKEEGKLKDMKSVLGVKYNLKAVAGYDEESNNIYVAFRGTDNFDNKIIDFKISKETYDGCKDCKVHLGFLQAYDSLKSALQTEISALAAKYPNANIVITGHSLGGAMATLCAVDLQNKGNKVSLYTYGSPRVGNEEFAKYANQKIEGLNYRISYINDPVTGVPPSSLGYLHTGQEIYYYDNKNYLVFPKGFDNKKNFNSWDLNQHSQYGNIEVDESLSLLDK